MNIHLPAILMFTRGNVTSTIVKGGPPPVRGKNMYYVARAVFLVKILNLGHVNLKFNRKILNSSKLQI